MKTLGRIWRLVGLPQLAIPAGFLATCFLVVGSLAMQLDPAAYADIPGEDLTFLWRRWSPVHSWLLAAGAALALFSASTFVCAVDALRVRLRHRVRTPSAYASTLMHLGFLIGIAGHLVSAVGAEKAEPVLLGEEATEAGGLGLRLLEAKVENGPTGEPRRVDARVEVTDRRAAGGVAVVRRLGFNRPIVLDAGRRLVLLLRTVPFGGGAGRFETGGVERDLRPGEEFAAGGATLRLLALFGPPQFRKTLAKIEVRAAGGKPDVQIVGAGDSIPAGGAEVRFVGAKAGVGLIALVDRNAGAPILLVGMLVFTAGVVLFLHGRLRRS